MSQGVRSKSARASLHLIIRIIGAREVVGKENHNMSFAWDRLGNVYGNPSIVQKMEVRGQHQMVEGLWKEWVVEGFLFSIHLRDSGSHREAMPWVAGLGMNSGCISRIQ